MISLTSGLPSPTPSAPACDTTDQWCIAVRDATGSEWLGAAAHWLIATPLHIALIILVALLARIVVRRMVNRLMHRAGHGTFPRPAARTKGGDEADPEARESRAAGRVATALAMERRRQRAATMASVLNSMASFVIFMVAAIMIVSELGYNVGPLLASAGVVGLALSFGAQSLVKDFLSGMFMFFEDQLGVGDEVLLGDTRGVVEALTLRVTRLRAEDGTVWYVRNGEILKVGNLSQQVAVPGSNPGGTAEPDA